MENKMEKAIDEIVINFCQKISQKYQINFLSLIAAHKFGEFLEDEVIQKKDGKIVVIDETGEEIAEIDSEWRVSAL